MSNNSITKEALATALKKLLEQQPLSKISVKHITDYCNISRNTFYYHFKDKYELINWMFYTDMLENVNSFNDPSKLTESFVKVCKALYAERKFYFACFQYVGQILCLNLCMKFIMSFGRSILIWDIPNADSSCRKVS